MTAPAVHHASFDNRTDCGFRLPGYEHGPLDEVTCRRCLAVLRRPATTTHRKAAGRGRVKPVRSSPRRRSAPQEGADWWENATRLLLARCGWKCERCGEALTDAVERHHRQRRRVGGDRLSNLLALHPRCHQWVTEHPAEATANGLIVSASAEDPALVPVRLAGRTGSALWLLQDDGTKIVVP